MRSKEAMAKKAEVGGEGEGGKAAFVFGVAWGQGSEREGMCTCLHATTSKPTRTTTQ